MSHVQLAPEGAKWPMVQDSIHGIHGMEVRRLSAELKVASILEPMLALKINRGRDRFRHGFTSLL